jgi:hypothetical protein
MKVWCSGLTHTMREHHRAHGSTSTNAPSNPQKQGLHRARKRNRLASVEAGRAVLERAEEPMGLDGKGRGLGELVERVEEHVRVQSGREGTVGVGGLGAGEGGEESAHEAPDPCFTYCLLHAPGYFVRRPENAPPC